MGEFDEFITGKLEVKVEGKVLNLDVKLDDKRIIKSSIGEKKTFEEKEEAFKRIDNLIINILKRSYPDSSSESLEGYYEKFGDSVFTEMLIKFGWIDKEAMEKESKN